MKIQINSFWPAIFGLIVATFLFCLPGEEFPEAGWFDVIQLDKLIHIGLFFTLVVLWCLPTRPRVKDKLRLSWIYYWIASAFIVYGIVIEIIQLEFIPHRSFDLFDIVANTTGCIMGLIFVRKY